MNLLPGMPGGGDAAQISSHGFLAYLSASKNIYPLSVNSSSFHIPGSIVDASLARWINHVRRGRGRLRSGWTNFVLTGAEIATDNYELLYFVQDDIDHVLHILVCRIMAVGKFRCT